MKINDVVSRIEERLKQLELSAAKASLAATGSKDTIRNWKRAAARGDGSASLRNLDKIAQVLQTSTAWLADGAGSPDDTSRPAQLLDVPLASWVSAGHFVDQEAINDLGDHPTIGAVDLPDGKWLALRVSGNSMNKISPPESVIFVNLDDRRLVPNGCYVISDESGAATYKRYRPAETPQFQPASYEQVDPPVLEGAIRVIGRVRRSIIDM